MNGEGAIVIALVVLVIALGASFYNIRKEALEWNTFSIENNCRRVEEYNQYAVPSHNAVKNSYVCADGKVYNR